MGLGNKIFGAYDFGGYHIWGTRVLEIKFLGDTSLWNEPFRVYDF